MIPNRLQPDTSLADNLALINQNFDILDDQDRTKIIYDGSTPKLLFGYQSGGFGTADYGLKIAKAGYDITTASNDQLAFSSAFDTLKVVSTATVTLSKTASNDFNQVAVAHGLSTVPAILAFFLDSGIYYPLPHTSVTVGGGLVDRYVSFTVNATNITFQVTCPNFVGASYYTPAFDLTIRYYVLQETAN